VSGWYVTGRDMRDDKLEGHSFHADQRLDVSITEAKPGELLWGQEGEPPEKIGAFDLMDANI
jgi:hypothetical protein